MFLLINTPGKSARIRITGNGGVLKSYGSYRLGCMGRLLKFVIL